MNKEEKKAIRDLIDSSNISLIGDGTVITSNKTINIILNLIEKLQKENQDITQQRDYYKARYNEFNEAFIENGRKLTK